MAKRLSSYEETAQIIADFEAPIEPPQPPTAANWYPDLNPTQRKIFDDPTKFILAHGEKGCRTLDTQMYTHDGLERLGRLAPQQLNVGGFTPMEISLCSFDGSNFRNASTSDYWDETDSEAIRITLRHGGEITGSPRHPVWCCWSMPDGQHGFGFMKLSEIASSLEDGVRMWAPLVGHSSWTKSELIEFTVFTKRQTCRICGEKAVARGLCHTHYANETYHGRRVDHISEEPSTITLTPALAYAIGALVGDGSLNIQTGDNRSIGFTNNDAQCVDAVRSGLLEAKANLNKCSSQYSHIVSGAELRQILQQMDLLHLSYFKRIPDQIIRSPKRVAAEFLSGLFDNHGTVDKNGVVSMTTVSEHLGRDVQDLLAAFGILCSRHQRKSVSGRPTWTLNVYGEHAWRFGVEIGFKIDFKQRRVLGPKKSPLRPDGFCNSRYAYPDPIRDVMKGIALGSRDGLKTRAWHNQNRNVHSFGSVPNRPKVERFIELYDCRDALSGFLISDFWTEVVSANTTSAKLADVCVPDTHCFLASGTINGNSGKSIGGLAKMVRHCYEEHNAFALIICPSIRTGADGVVHDLENLVLPAWKEGNRESPFIWVGDKLVPNPKDGQLKDHGIGLEYTPFKPEFDTKDRVMWIGNKHGGYSKVKLISIPYAEAIGPRIKGPAPSFIYVEELTDLDDPDYFTLPAAQLGRRRDIKGPQQLVASCNPKGPSHWVYKTFFRDVIDPATGEHDKAFSVYHVPVSENMHRLPAGYVETLHTLFKSNSIMSRRLLYGEWIDLPDGEALFKEVYDPSSHLIGDLLAGTGLTPQSGYTAIISMDLGQVNSAAVFEQPIPTEKGISWVVFDEVVNINKKILYRDMARDIVERMDFWDSLGKPFRWEIIADSSAVNQWRPGEGDYDAAVFEREFNEYMVSKGRPPIKVKGCPHGPGSIVARVRLVQEIVSEGLLHVSAQCPNVAKMFLNMVGDPKNPMQPRKDAAGHIHVWDGLSYGIFKTLMAPNGSAIYSNPTQVVRVELVTR